MTLQIYFDNGAVRVAEYAAIRIEKDRVVVASKECESPYSYNIAKTAKSIYPLQCGKPKLLWSKEQVKEIPIMEGTLDGLEGIKI